MRAGIALLGLTILVAGCSVAPPDPAISSLRSDYKLDSLTIAFEEGGRVYVGALPSDASSQAQQAAAKAALEKGIGHRLREQMTGTKRASVKINVKGLNCLELHTISLVGGFSGLSTEVAIVDAETGREIVPKRAVVANDTNGFGPVNFEAARKLEQDGDKNCPMLLALQLASSIVGENTRGAPSIVVPVATRK